MLTLPPAQLIARGQAITDSWREVLWHQLLDARAFADQAQTYLAHVKNTLYPNPYTVGSAEILVHSAWRLVEQAEAEYRKAGGQP